MPENITLRDPQGASAEILASLGFNCHRFTALRAGQPVEVLWSLPNFASGAVRPSSSGIPILFPFPGRIPGTKFVWEGKTYDLEPSDKFGNAIHGFCHTRPWRVIEQSSQRVVGQFHAWQDDPSLQARWPADFQLTASYELSGNRLLMEYLVENPGDRPLPCGLGTHPYFRVAIGTGDPNETVVRVPVTHRWELADMLPTGRRLPLPQAAALTAGEKFAALEFDDVLSGLTFQNGHCESSLTSASGDCTVTLRCNDVFRELVVYTPPHREAICIEPYTCVPGPFTLEERGIDAGLRVLQPGESFTAKVEIAVT
jgi:aldose 1-epimerase